MLKLNDHTVYKTRIVILEDAVTDLADSAAVSAGPAAAYPGAVARPVSDLARAPAEVRLGVLDAAG